MTIIDARPEAEIEADFAAFASRCRSFTINYLGPADHHAVMVEIEAAGDGEERRQTRAILSEACLERIRDSLIKHYDPCPLTIAAAD